MKKICFIAFAAVLAIVNACQGNAEPEVTNPSVESFVYPVQMTFYGDDHFGTRTVLNDETILWESTDVIKVLWGHNRYNTAVAKPYNSGVNAEFTTTVEEASSYYGVYPASASSSLQSSVLKVTVPSTQTGMFADANIAVAKADNQNGMSFKHVVSFLEFTIDRVGSLEFSSGSSKALAGVVSVNNFDEYGSPVYEISGESDSITLDIKSSGTYYIALLPDVKLDELKFTLSDGKTVLVVWSGNSVQMSAGKLVGLGNITERFRDPNSMGATLEDITLEELTIDEFIW